ncbi:hypothetical protein B0I75DRAFT_155102 [Yarrowia lipolytica]|nr:hypothetical protein B0I74DRAFT_149309 [Yarrowia lipolytica]RDW49573.1 hypothetical protein B0I75DRAFT_155102 [Yarrowia lipolytica]
MSVPDSVLGGFNGCPWSYREIRHELIISKKLPLNGGKGPQIQSRTPHSREIYPGYS